MSVFTESVGLLLRIGSSMFWAEALVMWDHRPMMILTITDLPVLAHYLTSSVAPYLVRL